MWLLCCVLSSCFLTYQCLYCIPPPNTFDPHNLEMSCSVFASCLPSYLVQQNKQSYWALYTDLLLVVTCLLKERKGQRKIWIKIVLLTRAHIVGVWNIKLGRTVLNETLSAADMRTLFGHDLAILPDSKKLCFLDEHWALRLPEASETSNKHFWKYRD